MFDSILIANRGEIACRIIRTARRLGIRSVAVYSDADADALHVKQSDAAIRIGPARASESYLRAERIIEAAKRSGADAIHPGYGFLSENADFAEACEREGLCFIGPPSAAIREMGAKDAAKARMQAAGVPVVPGYHGEAQDEASLCAAAEAVGYPLLVKAVAGGGGKGMRRVDRADDLPAAIAAAKREAQAAFGDPRVLLERFLERARHIEVQVFADAHGQCVHLFERDCSLQRRHQKVVEEAPAPGLGEARRTEIGAAAVRAAETIGYRNAGTVEFIVDASAPLDEAPFYFMEMNTRLQVEHPVTEAITGLDLVEWQLRVAAGEPLTRLATAHRIEGHAIEVRVYAEDPSQRYLPQSGPLLLLRAPAEGGGIRVDTGFAEGDTVGVHYDPMIAKLICHGRDRSEALAKLRRALGDYAIAGIRTNVALLAAIADHPAFAEGDIDTAFLERHAEALIPDAEAPADLIALICAGHLCARARERTHSAPPADPHSPWHAADGFRLNAPGFDVLRLADGKRELEIRVDFAAAGHGGPVELSWAERRVRLDAFALDGDRLVVQRDGERLVATYLEVGDDLHVVHAGRAQKLEHVVVDREASGAVVGGGAVLAPMPGKIIAVSVENGQKVKQGDPLLTLEAMKMEHVLRAPQRGVVTGLDVAVDEQVDEGVVLLSVEAG